MSTAAPDGTAPAAPAVPLTPPAEQAPPLPVGASAPAVDEKFVKMSSEAFAKRQAEAAESAQRKLLKDLGVDKPEDLKAALASLKALQDEKLSDKERTEKQIRELEKASEKGSKSAALAIEAVNELFASLPEDQRAAIDEMANGDPAERLRLIRFARKLGSVPVPAIPPAAVPGTAPPAQAATGTPPPAVPPAPPPPANLAPPPGAPRSSAQKTKHDEYQELQRTDPKKATVFFMLHERAINASAPPPT